MAKYRPTTGESKNRIETYNHVLLTTKIPREELRAISDQTRIEKLREANARLKNQGDPDEEPVYHGRVVTDITGQRPSPPRVPATFEPPSRKEAPHAPSRPLRETYHVSACALYLSPSQAFVMCACRVLTVLVMHAHIFRASTRSRSKSPGLRQNPQSCQ